MWQILTTQIFIKYAKINSSDILAFKCTLMNYKHEHISHEMNFFYPTTIKGLNTLLQQRGVYLHLQQDQKIYGLVISVERFTFLGKLAKICIFSLMYENGALKIRLQSGGGLFHAGNTFSKTLVQNIQFYLEKTGVSVCFWFFVLVVVKNLVPERSPTELIASNLDISFECE